MNSAPSSSIAPAARSPDHRGEAFYEKARLALDAVRQAREAVSATTGLKSRAA
jgi:DNA-binding transcriptional LysR family regulator